MTELMSRNERTKKKRETDGRKNQSTCFGRFESKPHQDFWFFGPRKPFSPFSAVSVSLSFSCEDVLYFGIFGDIVSHHVPTHHIPGINLILLHLAYCVLYCWFARHTYIASDFPRLSSICLGGSNITVANFWLLMPLLPFTICSYCPTHRISNAFVSVCVLRLLVVLVSLAYYFYLSFVYGRFRMKYLSESCSFQNEHSLVAMPMREMKR